MARIRRMTCAGGLAAAIAVATAVAAPIGAQGATAPASAGAAAAASHHPSRVLVVLFDQMRPEYADRFNMTNFKSLRDGGTNFSKAYLGYMGAETVIAHNVIVSGQLPKHMGWVDEAYRDTGNLLGGGVNSMQITGDLSLDNFKTLVDDADYPKLADYLHTAHPGSKFITVGEKSYAVESATAGSGDIAVRLSGRNSNVTSAYPAGCTNLGGRWRSPVGLAVPSYLTLADANDGTKCGRYFINSDKGLDYGTLAAFPSWVYPEDGNRMVPGSDPSALAGHTGGDTWAADAAMEMMEKEDWSGMFVTLGGIDKAGHMWGADQDSASHDCSTGAGQVHVDCMAHNADLQLGRMKDKLASLGLLDDTLIVLTADHGATHGGSYYGKTTSGAGDSNWYWAPNGVWDGGAFDTTTYNSPSPALLPLNATGNLQFAYQSTSIQAWLTDSSPAQLTAEAAVMKTLPGVMASYYKSGDHYVLAGKNAMAPAERKWWNAHGQAIIDTMAGASGPDVVGLLHDNVSYGAYGDHGGVNEEVQRVPVVFWQQGMRPSPRSSAFRTPDIMPTILQAMGISLTQTVDGKAWRLGQVR
jgi:hypothetical protein